MTGPHPLPRARGSRWNNLEDLLTHVAQRRRAGEELTDDRVIEAFPEWMPELELALQALLDDEDSVPNVDATVNWRYRHTPHDSTDQQRWIRCPNCGLRHAASSDTDFSDLKCTRCSTQLDRRAEPDRRRVAHYNLLERIGCGGFGTVWRAWDTKLNCQVAFKMPRRNDLTEAEADRFIREAQVSAHLRRHPNIVGVHEARWDGNIAYIVSDFIEGKSLKEWTDGKPVPQEQAATICRKIARALHHAHQAGIVHRDLKPDNVLVDADNEPHIADFGLAKLDSENEDIGVTVDGQVLGTVAYMAPEQARGNSREVDRRSDVYALGMILYELVSGTRPFAGSFQHMLEQITMHPPTPPSKWNPSVSKDIDTICMKCLEKDPAKRYQTAKEVAEELGRVLANEAIMARPVSVYEHAIRWCQRNERISWLTLAMLAVALLNFLLSFTTIRHYIHLFEDNYQARVDLSRNDFTRWVASNAQEKITEKFRLVAAAAKEKPIRTQLEMMYSKPAEYKQLMQSMPLGDRPVPKTLRPLQAWLSDDFRWLDRGTPGEDDYLIGPDLGEHVPEDVTSVYSWFICDREGRQIARDPMEPTLGNSYAFRSYFTGLDHDLPSCDISSIAWKPGDGPRLSTAFVTRESSHWVIAISAPIFSDKNDEFLGVIGVFICLRDLTELIQPDGERTQLQSQMLVSLVDPRCQRDQAKVIADHAWFKLPLDQARINLDDLNHHQLPEQFGNRPWRVSFAPVELPGTTDRLVTVVREDASQILKPARALQNNVLTSGLLVLLGCFGLLLPLWLMIVRTHD